MKFEAFASSSHGNAYAASDRKTRLGIEAGISHRALARACGGVAAFSGWLISHEHKDHAKCVNELLKDGVLCYMSLGTAEALGLAEKTDDGYEVQPNVRIVSHGQAFSVGSFTVVPFTTYHDAQEPLGFLVKSEVDGESLVFATDTVNLRYRFLPPATILAIEANFDKHILERSEKLPDKTKQRIQNTHMEIDMLLDVLREADFSRCREIILLHLSDAMSNENHFIYRVERAVPKSIKVTAAPRQIERK